jgi:hypothetical protein
MSMNNRSTIKTSKIRSLEDLRLEKTKVRNEILKKEGDIRSDYKNILDLLTFRNIVSNLADSITVQSAVVSQVLSFGKALFARKKKKKKE